MKYSYLLCLFLAVASCKKAKSNLTKITAKTIAVDSSFTSSTKIDSMVAPYKEKLASEMKQVLSYTPRELVRTDGEMQSTLGNLTADLYFDVANPIYQEKTKKSIDFSMFNYGGIRAAIPQGKVTTEHAFKLMPFENELVVAEITGDKIIELVQYFIENKRAHPLSKNVSLTITGNDFTLKLNGKDFDKNKTYSVLTSDYLQSGGDRMNFFKNPKELTKLDYKARNAIIDYFKKVDTLQATTDNRVIIK